MRDNFGTYVQKTLHSTHTAIVNLFIFLPYFFSVSQLIKTLFAPWKNMVIRKTHAGFSMAEFNQRITNNLVSRFMGLWIRSTLILAYMIIHVFYVLLLPFIYVAIIATLPITYLLYKLQPSPDERKQRFHDDFLKRHLADQSNVQAVEQWFETYYLDSHQKPWWTLEKLMTQPPLGRNLSSGYTPTLDQYASELTNQPAHYKHLVGRREELDRMQQILSKSGESNVIIVGEDGSGRKTLVEALAGAIYAGKGNTNLAYKRIMELDMEKVLAVSDDFVQREEILSGIFKEAEEAKNIIIMIGNLHEYVSDEKDKINLSNIIVKYAATPTLQFISLSTPYFYQKYIFANQAIAQIFEKVDVNEVDVAQTITILKDIALNFERKNGVVISYGAIVQAAEMAQRFISQTPLPESAIELLDEASVYARSHLQSTAVTPHVINTLIQQKTHVPTEMTDSIKQKLLHLEEALRTRVIAQDEALQKLAAALRKSFVMTTDHKKPLASFLFLGPTGVGKTETAKAITEVFFNDIKNMMRFDMSLYQTKNDIAKLVGSPETGEPGLLAQALRQQQFGTLLLDELEKADHDLINIFLTILDEGYFTDGFGKRVDCTNLVVIATSNAGADFIYAKTKELGGAVGDITSGLIDHLVEQHLFSPEFLNRFDGVVVYKPLTNEAITQIAQKALEDTKKMVETKHGFSLQFSPDFIAKLIQQGYDPRFGARNMQRVIRDEVEDKIAKLVLENSVQKGQTITF